MVRTASLLGGVLCLTASVGIAFGGWLRPITAEPAAEELTVTPAVYDFGTVGQSEILAAEFTVTNRHRQPVHIAQLAKSCSCVQLTADRHDLTPGESTTVRVGWKTFGKRGRVGDTLGIHYQFGISLHMQNFRLHAEVIPDVTAEPAAVAFGGDRPRQQTVTLRLRDPNADIRVTTAHSSADAVAVAPAAEGRSVTLTFDPAGQVASGVEHRLLLKLSAGGQSWLEVPLSFASHETQSSRSSP